MGFTGIVVGFDSHPVIEWSRVARIRLKALLACSALLLVISLILMVSLSVNLSPENFTAVFSTVALIVLGWWNISYVWSISALPKAELLSAGWGLKLFRIVEGLLFIWLVAQFANLLALKLFWIPYSLVVAQLCAGIVQFIRFVVSRNRQLV